MPVLLTDSNSEPQTPKTFFSPNIFETAEAAISIVNLYQTALKEIAKLPATEDGAETMKLIAYNAILEAGKLDPRKGGNNG